MDNPGGNIGLHSCTKCSFTTKYKSNLLRHQVKHDRESEIDRQAALKCDACGQVFTNKYNCARHKKFRCSQNPSIVQYVNSQRQDVYSPSQNVYSPGQIVNSSTEKVNHVLNSDTEDDNDESNRIFPCPTCYRVFSRESRRILHLPDCKHVTSSLQCYKCGLILASRSSKSQHIKRCSGTRLDMQRSQIASVVNANNSYNTTTNNTTNNNTNIQNQINNTININGFGKESIGYLSSDFLAKQALRNGSQGAMECIKAIHFNPDHPENQNIRLLANDDIDKNFVAVYDEDRWDIRDIACTVSDVLQNVCILLKNRAGQVDFQKKYEDHWMSICDRLSKFTRTTNPHDFYTILRTVKHLIRNFEKIEV